MPQKSVNRHSQEAKPETWQVRQAASLSSPWPVTKKAQVQIKPHPQENQPFSDSSLSPKTRSNIMSDEQMLKKCLNCRKLQFGGRLRRHYELSIQSKHGWTIISQKKCMFIYLCIHVYIFMYVYVYI